MLSIFRALASIVSSIAGVESLCLQTGSVASTQLMIADGTQARKIEGGKHCFGRATDQKLPAR
jgi:hypothetical protein